MEVEFGGGMTVFYLKFLLETVIIVTMYMHSEINLTQRTKFRKGTVRVGFQVKVFM